jgi:lipid II:glycine glycyltransferase (peptidoglycan interpeptide bridge formation enzyme)
MLILDRRLSRFIPYRVVFFPTPAMVQEVTEHLALIWMVRLIAASAAGNGRHIVQHRITATSCVDLRQDLNVLFRAMHATFRNKIGKAERLGDRVKIERNGPQAKAEFLQLYANLTSAKPGQVTPVNADVLDRYSPWSDIFLIYLDGEALCGHVNLRDPSIGRARLLYSATRRFTDPQIARLGGLLNCYLHWQEMRVYKEQGFEVYDLGGVSLGSPQAAGIEQFKLGFGGAIVEEHDYICAGLPLLGRAAMQIFGTGRNR